MQRESSGSGQGNQGNYKVRLDMDKSQWEEAKALLPPEIVDEVYRVLVAFVVDRQMSETTTARRNNLGRERVAPVSLPGMQPDEIRRYLKKTSAAMLRTSETVRELIPWAIPYWEKAHQDPGVKIPNLWELVESLEQWHASLEMAHQMVPRSPKGQATKGRRATFLRELRDIIQHYFPEFSPVKNMDHQKVLLRLSRAAKAYRDDLEFPAENLKNILK